MCVNEAARESWRGLVVVEGGLVVALQVLVAKNKPASDLFI